jgi:pyrroloquinoline-quinone synthase
VLAFNLALMGTCSAGEPEMAFACLGIIEYSFADLSAIIGRSVVDRGWVPGDRLVHYALHAEIDKEHAEGFFRMVQRSWNAGGAARSRVEQGLALGLYIFHRLYEDLACQQTAQS